MGCLSRVGCLVVVAAAGAVGYWLYGDQLPSELSRAASTVAGKVHDVADRLTRSRPAPASTADPRDSATTAAEREAERRIAWATVTPQATPPDAIAALTRADGPAFITLGAGDLAALAGSALQKQLPPSVSGLQLALDGNQLLARAVIDLSDIASSGTVGQLLGTALAGRDSVRLAGTVEPLRDGAAQVHIVALRVKGIDVPPRLIPSFIGALRRGPRTEGLADDALLLPLPRSVADLRIANGRLTLYKAVPTP